MAEHTVLVYGTLRPNLGKDIVKIKGTLYDMGWFPAVILEGDTEVVCERITVDDDKLAGFDRYESYYEDAPEKSFYIRQKIGNDWIYVFNSSVEGHEIVKSGDWVKYKEMEVA